MKAVFQIEDSQPRQVEVEFDTLIVAGWAGRDIAAIEHHIEELAAIGVPRPSSVPLYYRIADNQLTQKETVQALGEESSGEVETFVFSVDGEMYVSIASDHTDRKLETYSVAMSKQVCVKPLAGSAWRLADVADYWDELIIRSYIVENGVEVLYQEGPLASLRTPQDLVAGYTGGAAVLPAGAGMTCGTVGAIGGIRPSVDFTMELHDPRRQRTLRHRYHVETLPVVA
ncbi:DUF2848 domain-containing protein [Achromobacter insolitus]|uniref:DUF2848 domain-containing protein n=1 Tax=Achromobacter insolitus TaxID=217204 RepID=A0A6S7EWE7_9BURK|nr:MULTISPECIES: DUF2848 domain-containing protein [Achromobacter]GLK93390.1 hypothetical protein GCM10008164_11270 [Achromobacter xylosoxidans]APX74631.1 hypothetical protein BUW96_06905 [Achromobacter insolitus]AVG39515.1 DUF2848 domain-containing protein [Achromobacter insolitus]AXA70201.1 DUF2848 domain-containing protein [Achromobacter insolitus]MCP1403148.1 hypothetical protein [Achromobacter insolitus]